jgi:hypothetical protein
VNRIKRRENGFNWIKIEFILSWIWTVMFNILRDFGLLPGFISEQEFLYGIITHVIAMTSTVKRGKCSKSVYFSDMESNSLCPSEYATSQCFPSTHPQEH